VVILLREEPGLVVAATAGDVPEAVQGARVGTEREVRATLDALGLEARASLLVPLVFRGQSLGILAAFDRRGGSEAFDAEEERLLIAFAASAATAVSTARSVETRRLRDSLAAAEAERARWARELHDETLQGLGGLRMLLAAARRREDARGVRASVEQAVAQIDTEIENLRTLIRELRPAALDELGPAPAIEELAARISDRHGIEIVTSVALDGRRSPELEVALYRIAQEALNNAVKHANASRIAIEVSEADGALRLTVADDGGGFDPDEPRSGFGLTGMRERVELLGGELEIRSSRDGTSVAAALPV
jgi:signal transduction histidine kinase